MPVLLLLALASLPLARAHLAQGQLDEVLLDLFDKGPSPAEEAKVLCAAAERAHERRDLPLALQLAQRAEQRDPAQPRAAQLLAEWALAAREYEDAQRYAALWRKAAPASDEAKRFSLRVKELSESWHPVEVEVLHKERHRRPTPDIAQSEPSPEAAPAPVSSGEVILYGTSWCGVCKQARHYFASRGIPYIDHDIERDRAAAKEMARKEAEAGVQHRGVPVLDVHGQLIQGFSPESVEAALR